jgi:hypothetical protein
MSFFHYTLCVTQCFSKKVNHYYNLKYKELVLYLILYEKFIFWKHITFDFAFRL